MGIINNHRWEQLSQNLAGGMSEVDAHEAAGYKRNRHNASRLATQEHIRARVREIQERAAARVELSAMWVLEKLVEVHAAAMRGNPVLDRYGKPTGATIKNLSAANRALELIGKSDGIAMFTEKSDVTHRGDPIAELMESIAGRSRSTPNGDGSVH